MSKEERITQILEMVSQWRDSGMSQADFTTANKITIHK